MNLKKKRVAVIGSGLGGLSSALLLSKEGFDVKVFEMNEKPGGKANSIHKNNFRFDTGPSLITMPFVLKDLFHSAGYSVCLMRELKNISPGKKLDVIVIDTIGFLKTLYAISDVAFVGGSLVNCGGHNPLEPAAFSKPIIFGYDMSDFDDISRMLLDAGGAVRVKNTKDLYNALVSLIENDKKAMEMGRNALKVLTANKGAVEKTIQVIRPYL